LLKYELHPDCITITTKLVYSAVSTAAFNTHPTRLDHHIINHDEELYPV